MTCLRIMIQKLNISRDNYRVYPVFASSCISFNSLNPHNRHYNDSQRHYPAQVFHETPSAFCSIMLVYGITYIYAPFVPDCVAQTQMPMRQLFFHHLLEQSSETIPYHSHLLSDRLLISQFFYRLSN